MSRQEQIRYGCADFYLPCIRDTLEEVMQKYITYTRLSKKKLLILLDDRGVEMDNRDCLVCNKEYGEDCINCVLWSLYKDTRLEIIKAKKVLNEEDVTRF